MGKKYKEAKWKDAECCATCRYLGQNFDDDDWAQAFGKDFCKFMLIKTFGHKVCKSWTKKDK